MEKGRGGVNRYTEIDREKGWRRIDKGGTRARERERVIAFVELCILRHPLCRSVWRSTCTCHAKLRGYDDVGRRERTPVAPGRSDLSDKTCRRDINLMSLAEKLRHDAVNELIQEAL